MLVTKHNESTAVCRPFIHKETFILSFIFLACAIVFMCGFYTRVHAAEVTLTWEASPSPDVAGYNIYYNRCSLTENCTIDGVAKNNLEVWQINIDDISSSTQPTYTVHNLSDINKYAFALTAYSDSGDESDFSNEVNFTPPNSSPSADQTNSSDTPNDNTNESDSVSNTAPTVDAGQNQSISFSLGKAILSGRVTDDGLPEGGTMIYKWYQKNGAGTADFDNPSQLTTSVSFSQPGSYILVLSANDGELASSDSIRVDVSKSNSEDTPPPAGDDNSTEATQSIIIDNSDTAATSSQGTWKDSVGENFNAENSVFGKNGAVFTWHFISPSSGTFDLFMWWTYHHTRSSSIPVSIESEKGVEIVTVDQQKNAAQWVKLGSFNFSAGESYDITVTAPDEGSKTTCADAVKLTNVSLMAEPVVDEELIFDNLDDQNVSSTGRWRVSAGKDPYGNNSVYGKKGATFSWTFVSQTTGMQEVSAWWTYHRTRSTSVPISIETSNGIEKVTVDQTQNASQWVSLGTYFFNAGESYKIKFIAPNQGRKTTCVDAIKLTYMQN